MASKVGNLYDDVFAASGLEADRRFKSWVKFVTKVDQTAKNGYAFVGDFVREGTSEYEVKPQVFLVAATTGSAKYHTMYYQTVVMDAQGNLSKGVVKTDDSESGWALRIRDAMTKLVSETSQAEPTAREKLAAAIAKMSDAEVETLLSKIEDKKADQPKTKTPTVPPLALLMLGAGL